jgi:hypothetical protein
LYMATMLAWICSALAPRPQSSTRLTISSSGGGSLAASLNGSGSVYFPFFTLRERTSAVPCQVQSTCRWLNLSTARAKQ